MRGAPVAEETPNTPGPFDVHTIKVLIRMMSRHNINEVDLRQGDRRIRLLRGVPTSLTSVAAPPAPMSVPVMPAAAAPAAVNPAAPAPAAGKPLYEIKSPTPGTF